jgi:hypothetical protein
MKRFMGYPPCRILSQPGTIVAPYALFVNLSFCLSSFLDKPGSTGDFHQKPPLLQRPESGGRETVRGDTHALETLAGELPGDAWPWFVHKRKP